MSGGNKPRAKLRPVNGVAVGVAKAGLAAGDRNDIAAIVFSRACPCAAVFTRNSFVAAPVIVARQNLARSAGNARGWIVNAGNANCGTGEPGLRAARQVCDNAARMLNCETAHVLPFSTGVIMEPVDAQKLARGAQAALSALEPEGWNAAAEAIMTTDTVPKGTSLRFAGAGKSHTVTGIAKGSGMIHPDMATMLAFLATDAPVGQDDLRRMLTDAVAQSFNTISVDGDTSTNDSVAIAATGTGSPLRGTALAALAESVRDVCAQLARAVVADGEGCCRLATVTAGGLVRKADCLAVARSVACSPLVKAMLHSGDPNLGRLLMAAGKTGISFGKAGPRLTVNGNLAFAEGVRNPKYSEKQACADFSADVVRIEIHGPAPVAHTHTYTFSDLSEEYVRINASYRT